MVNDKGSGRNVPAGALSKFQVVKSSKLGRYIIAAKDLLPGTVIHREKPVAVGPAAFFEGFLCFNCLKPIVSRKVDNSCCTKCKVAPLCQPACELISGYHEAAECQLFVSNQSSALEIRKHAAVLLPLRLWLLRETQPEVWRTINQMEDHAKERRNTPVWKDRDENVVKVLQKLGLIPDDDKTLEIMQQICGILDVNSFELRSPGDSEKHLMRGVYMDAALVAHDCRGNTHLTVDDKHELTIYASTPIEKGAAIYFNYTASFLGTVERRANLRKGKYFECECELCRDPSELRSHLSSLICPRCHRGCVTIQNPLAINPYSPKMKWECGKCKALLSGKMIKTTLDLIRSIIEESENSNAKELESVLQKMLLTVHTNHYLALEMKQKLLSVYRCEISSINPHKKILERMLILFEEVLAVLDITEPGISRSKGIILYEMHFTMAMLANKNYASNEIPARQLVSQLEKAEELLQKALSNLLLEPAAMPEGRLAKRGLHELKLLRQNIADVKALPTTTEKPKRQPKRKTDFVK